MDDCQLGFFYSDEIDTYNSEMTLGGVDAKRYPPHESHKIFWSDVMDPEGEDSLWELKLVDIGFPTQKDILENYQHAIIDTASVYITAPFSKYK